MQLAPRSLNLRGKPRAHLTRLLLIEMLVRVNRSFAQMAVFVTQVDDDAAQIPALQNHIGESRTNIGRSADGVRREGLRVKEVNNVRAQAVQLLELRIKLISLVRGCLRRHTLRNQFAHLRAKPERLRLRPKRKRPSVFLNLCWQLL